MNSTKIYAEANNSETPSVNSQTPVPNPSSKKQLSPLIAEIGVGETLQSPLAAKHKKKKKIKKVVRGEMDSGAMKQRGVNFTVSNNVDSIPVMEMAVSGSAFPTAASDESGSSSSPSLKMSGPPSSLRRSPLGTLKTSASKGDLSLNSTKVALDTKLSVDFGIDPALKEADKQSIIKYRKDIRRMSIHDATPDGPNGPKVISSEVAEMVAYFEERTREPRFLILPESQYMQRWDLVTLIALMFTAFVTPYEVALLESEVDYFKVTTWDGLFSINRVIDLIFFKDMVMQFFLAYRLNTTGGGAGLLIRNFRSIRNNYLHSWFLIDLLSILPYDMIGSMSDNEALENLKIIRVVR